jgi:alanine dehydrogenase
MGFSFAKPTTFDDPMFKVGSVDYYAVDHTPSYLWESASRSISAALVVHLPTVLAGPEAWREQETIRRAVVIDEGVILNPDILSFQGRQPDYPHEPIAPALP